ncbi:hypothetical protein L7F22_049703 [Adiantum nelumboides]|nr:hypothetical protein [Adiantum nelumboides]
MPVPVGTMVEAEEECPDPEKPTAPEAKQPKSVPVRAITRGSGVVIEGLPIEEPAPSKLNPKTKAWEHSRSTWKEKGKAKEFDDWKDQRELAAKITENLEKKKPEVPECFEARSVQRIPVAVTEALLLQTQIIVVIQLDYKNRKQWEPLLGVILDGGAGVNIIGEHMKEKIGITNFTTAPFRKKSSSRSSTNTGEELPTADRIYDSSSEDVESNPTANTRTDKEAKATAKRKSGLPNWLLSDDQEIEEWNLGLEEEFKMIKINNHLKKELKDKAWSLILKFKNVFVREHANLKGLDLEVCQHRIPLKPDARPVVRLHRYKMNSNYAKKVNEEIDNLLKAGVIIEVASSDWLFPIVVVPKKNGKLRVCVDYRKLNAQTIKDPFLLPSTDMMLDEIVGHEMYSFMDGYKDRDNDEDEEDDDDQEGQVGTSGHPGPDDNDDDDQDQPGTGPSSRGAATKPSQPPAPQSKSLRVPKENEPEHRGATGTTGESQLHSFERMIIPTTCSIGVLTYKKRRKLLPGSVKGKEMAIGLIDGSLTEPNPWLNKEFKLAKEIQLKEFLRADDMYSDMERICMLYAGVK